MEEGLYLDFEYYMENILTIGYDRKIKGLTIRDISFVLEYLHILKDIIDNNNEIYFWCGSYEIAKLIERLLPNSGKYEIHLIDDFKNKDRSYINNKDFTKSKLYIPVPYVMWGVKVDKEIGVDHAIYYPFSNSCVGASENGTLKLETINEIKRIVSMIGEEKGLNKIEILMIISNFIQAYIQYISENGKEVSGKMYIIPEEEKTSNINPRDINSVILKNYGLCASIANFTILLANNPTLGIDIREVFGDGHSWNIVNLGGTSFYVDNSRAITRNKHLFEETLKASELTTDFFLIGTQTADQYGKYKPDPNIWVPNNISKNDFDRNYINAVREHLEEIGLLSPHYPKDSITFHTKIK